MTQTLSPPRSDGGAISPDQMQRYALALQAISESVYDWDIGAGTFDHVGIGAAAKSMWADEPRTPDDWLATIHPEDRAGYASAVQAHVRGQTEKLVCEYRYRARDGKWRWARQQGIAMRDPDGRAVRVVGTVGDITDQKERETELESARAEAEAAHRDAASANEIMNTVLDNMSDAVLLLDKDFKWLLANKRLTEFPGFPEGYARTGMSGYDLLRYQAQRGEFGPIEDVEAAVQERARLMRTPGGVIYKRRVETGQFIEFKFTPLADGRLLAVYRDLTELKNSEEARQQAEERLRDAIEFQAGGFAIFDKGQRLLSFNSAYARLAPDVPEWCTLGAAVPDIVRGLARAGVVPSLAYGNVEAHIGFWSAWLSEPREPAEINFVDRVVRIDGRRTAEGNMVFLYTDVTELKQREAALERAEQRLREAIDYQSGGFALYDPDYRLIMCNAAFAALAPHVEEWSTPGTPLEVTLRAVARRGGFKTLDPSTEHQYVASWFRYMANPDRPIELHLGDGRWMQVEGRKTPDGNTVVLFNDLTKLRARESELAQTQSRLADAIENQAGGFALFDPNLTLITCNATFAQLAPDVPEWSTPGLLLETILNAVVRSGQFKGLAGKAGADYVARWMAYMSAPDRPVELRIGDSRWVQLEARKTAEGNTVVLFNDLSALKQRERELAETQARLTQAIESLVDGFAYFDADERLVVCNEAYRRYAHFVPQAITPGYTLEEGLRARFTAGPPSHQDLDVERYIRGYLRRHRSGNADFEIPQTGGRFARIRASRTPEGGNVVVVADITELRVRARQLAQTQDRLTQAIENLVDGFAYFDAQDKLVICNEGWRRFMGYAPKAITPGYTVEDGLRDRFAGDRKPPPEIDVERFVQRFLQAHRSGHANLEVRAGNDRYVRIRNRATPEGGIVVVVVDISELKARAAELEKARDVAETGRAEAQAANQAKSTFLATMSHEIRTPMNGVMGMMDVLEHQGLSDEQRRTVGTMRSSAQALLRIVDDILDFSKIEAGRLELEETAFSLSGLIESVVATFVGQARAKGLRLTSEIQPDSHDALVGDPTRVRQILFNLLGNALKFTERGRVRVEAATEPLGEGRARIRLAVHDTGIGLDEEERSRLFRPFAQADSSTTRRFGGSGLGLSIVRRLAQLMGGDVTVDSVPGQGSSFSVTLDLRAAPANSPLNTTLRRASGKIATDASQAGKRVLVVDDHPVNRDVLVMQLNLLGIASDTANDGHDGLDLWAPGKYAVVLADIHMPRMDGYEMTRQMRTREAGGPRTPVVAVTANALKGEEARCHDAGMDGYLAKPVSLDRLRATLERWLAVDISASPDAGDAAGAPSAVAVDRDVLAAWLGDDTDAIDGLLRKFRRTVVDAERDIEAAFRIGDLATLAAAAHKLKGAAHTVGASRLGKAAGKLEESGKAGDRVQCRDGLGGLASQIRLVLAELPKG